MIDRRTFVGAAAAFAAVSATGRSRAAALDASPITFTGDGGVTLDYRAAGSGPPLVFVPGGPGFASHYLDGIAERLSGVRAILLDPRGTGASSDLPPRPDLFTVAHVARDIEALRVALGVDRIGLLGHSFGGFFAMAYAARYPARVSRLLLIDSAPPDLTAEGKAQSAALLARLPASARAELRRLKQLAADDPEAAKRGTMLAISPAFFANPANAARVRSYIEQDIYYSPSAALAFDDDLQRHQSVGPAVPLAAPVEILYGTDDVERPFAFPPVRARFPHAHVDLVPGAGHLPWMERPTAFFAAVRAFLARTA